MDNANYSTAASFTALPHEVQLTCLTMLPLEDILDVAATSRGMRLLCGEDAAWRAIYKDMVGRCCLQGEGVTSAQRQRSLEDHERRVEQQTCYKKKALTHLLGFFGEEQRGAEEIVMKAMDAEFQEYYCSNVYRCPCQDNDDSDSDYECGHFPCSSDFDYIYDNWDEEEWAADEKNQRLEKLIIDILKALGNRTKKVISKSPTWTPGAVQIERKEIHVDRR